MKIFIIIITMIFTMILLQGCSIFGHLDRIPKGEFDEFRYDRTGNVTSAHITALNAKKTNGRVKIESISVTTDYGPFVSFKLYLKGYKRSIDKKKMKKVVIPPISGPPSTD